MTPSKDLTLASLIPLISVVLGTILGFLTGILLSRFNQRQNITAKILEQYFKARDDICQTLSELANLKSDAMMTDDKIEEAKREVSKIYYKYYDLLPKEVLQEINCLYICLSDRNNRLFTIKNNRLAVLQGEELHKFLEHISLLNNFKHYAYFLLNGDDSKKRRSVSINIQARSVLNKLNDFFTLENLLSWTKHLPKKSRS